MVYRLLGGLIFGSALALAACGGEGLTLPPEGEAAHIEVIWGDDPPQSGRVGSQLEDSLVVKVTDVRARPVEGAIVGITFPEAGGEASPDTVTTDANGIAWSYLTLGTTVGTITGTAAVPVDPGFTPVEATFTVIARSDDADSIALVSGNDQAAPAGTVLPAPLVVQVTDEFGNPISGVTVSWSVEGGGSVSEETTVTGANGQTSVTRTLGSAAGQQVTLASVQGLAGSPITFSHTATAGTANRIEKVSGDGQSALVGTEVRDPLVVRVLDANGNPIPNEPVTWVPASGGGSVSPQNSTTDAQGLASTRWTLGPTAGTNTVTAVASRAGTSTVSFTATATAGSPSASNSDVSASPGTITAGSGSSTITVTVRDGSNNPVSGVSVSITSSGSGNTITPASASTNSSGVATFSFSSTVAETKTITATAGGVELEDKPTITVTRASATIEITSDDPEPSTVGQAITVEFTVTGSGGGTPTGEVTVRMEEAPNESCTATLSNGSGSCQLTPTVPGTGSNNRRVIRATYGGDASFGGDDDTENHRVNPAGPASTTTTITSDSPDPSAPGAAITVSFTVTSSAGTPSGNVQVTDPMGGSCNASVSTGSCQYTPGGTGPRTITATYEGSSGFSGSSDTEEHTVSPASGNRAPVANPDQYTAQAGVTRTVGQDESLLNNDTDPDAGDILSAVMVTQPTNGVIRFFDPSGTFDYTPNQDATSDSFTYLVRDLEGAESNVTTVTFVITP